MFDDLVKAMDVELFSVFSQPAVYNSSVIVDAIVDKNVIRVTAMGDQIRNAYEITVLNSQVGTLSIGDTIEIGFDKYTIANIETGDDSITTGAATHVVT